MILFIKFWFGPKQSDSTNHSNQFFANISASTSGIRLLDPAFTRLTDLPAVDWAAP
jgi:hypothetical protein